MNILTCLGIGLAGGILSGLMGVGGGIVLIPLMIIFLKMTQHQAQGTSLAIIMLSFVSMMVYYKKGHVNLGIAALIGVGFIVGGLIGAYFATSLPEHVLKKCFAVFLLIVAFKMLFFK
ncbi:MAG: sulfite exporter TauE/SafE family protein [Endomicrobia bacterium]|nr:sulfite exporter TauE/SafE family protein [Endomicrobiia bacterium]MCL2799118.1 sulfite exporter TauE/SafE family protein [Endomicrobiia bacterium]